MITSYYISNNLRLILYGILLLAIPIQSNVLVLPNYVYKKKIKTYIEFVLLVVRTIITFLIARELFTMRT